MKNLDSSLLGMRSKGRGALCKFIGACLFSACTALSAQTFDPTTADFKQIFNAEVNAPTVWRYADNPNIFVFDFPSLALQGNTFNRVTQFTEQQTKNTGYPKVLNNDELSAYIQASRRTQENFAYGHDVLISELVHFFNFAERDGVALNPEEIALRDFVVSQGFVRLWRGFYQAMKPDVVILSVPRVQDRPKLSRGARYTILLHEMSHGEFYANPHYRDFCIRFWNEKLTQDQRDKFVEFLKNFNYDTTNETLLVNEMQAYLMFTPDGKSFSARKLGVADAELDSMRQKFRAAMPPIRLPLTFPESM